MKRHIVRFIIFLGILSFHVTSMEAAPFVRTFTTKEYDAHNRCFDVLCDEYGTVFVANFEGLLYYDGSAWRKLHTPGINRVTRVFKGKDGRIYISGHDFYGYLTADKMGHLQLTRAKGSDTKRLEGMEVERTNILQFGTMRISVVQNNGLLIRGENYRYDLTDADGLASNNVANIAYD